MNKLYILNIEQFNNPDIYMKAVKQLSEDRLKKADAINHPGGKFRSVGAGFLIAHGLEEAGLSPRTEPVALSSKGKPYLPEHPDVHFNLSHSGKYVVCAFADKTVGIDIEEIREVKATLVKSVLDKAEMSNYRSTPDDFKLQRFFELWTGKEAFLKHIATGLSVKPNEINSLYRDKLRTLNFHVWHIIPQYIMTLCTEMERPELTEVRL